MVCICLWGVLKKDPFRALRGLVGELRPEGAFCMGSLPPGSLTSKGKRIDASHAVVVQDAPGEEIPPYKHVESLSLT